MVYEKPIDLNPLETAIDELKQKAEDFELVLKKKDLTLLELYLQGGIIPQVNFCFKAFLLINSVVFIIYVMNNC